jgi:ppGpp synthetase/RelA/SpoT-type nucleotidyltranferase
MAKSINVSPEREQLIKQLVNHYVTNQAYIRRFLSALHAQISDVIDRANGDPLSALVHSVKYRMKDSEHLREKLMRKSEEYEKKQVDFPYTLENLFVKVNDLAGYRILHLHTRQFEELNRRLIPVLEAAHSIIEGPVAKTWDEETKAYYKSINIKTEDNERMYSSVHYVIQPSTKTPLTMEIQVRTLADEIWGEIDHKINYPYSHESIACREQIRALARVTSSCSRLVDAIMTTHEDWEKHKGTSSIEPKEDIASDDQGGPALVIPPIEASI